jgi:phosphoribosylformimino-5-aminoimidazole carboxamide ribotide isomerase
MVDIIPVIDIQGGVAVSGKSGNREHYRPLVSVFSKEPDPIKIARNLPFERLYVADLDGIVNQKPDIKTLKTLAEMKRTMVDLGVRDPDDLDVFDELGSDIVLGTETISDSNVLSETMERFDSRPIVSVDIKNGRVLSTFLPSNPVDAYNSLTTLGVKRVIFLDITAVGTLKTSFSFIKDLNRTVEILLGGGITGKDLEDMERIKVDGVLIGTALHKGLLDVESWK